MRESGRDRWRSARSRSPSPIPTSRPLEQQPKILIRGGTILIDRRDFKIQEIWKVDRVNRPSNIAGINLNEGDIIMQLLDKDLKQILWVRLLRRIGTVAHQTRIDSSRIP